MLVLLIEIGLGLLVAWGIWRALSPGPLFEIRIKNGVARRTRGAVSASFVREVQETCQDSGVDRGAIRGTPRSDRIGLDFSGPISPACRQRLRNLWSNRKESLRRVG